MNHLGVDGRGKLVFDAGDAGLDDDEDEDDVDEADDQLSGKKPSKAAVDTRVAVDALKAKYLPFLAANRDELLAKPISTTLRTFAFSSAPGSSVPEFDMSLLNLAAPSSSVPNGSDGATRGDANPPDDHDYGGMGGQEDFFADDAGDDGGDFSGGFGGPSFLGGASNGADGGDDEHVSYDNGGFSMTSAGFGTYNPSLQPSGKDLILAMRGDDADDDEAAGMFGYFDRQLVAKNWAGPEHWKVRRAVVGGALFGPAGDKKGRSTTRQTSRVLDPI
jgi:condensin complex subunit 2